MTWFPYVSENVSIDINGNITTSTFDYDFTYGNLEYSVKNINKEWEITSDIDYLNINNENDYITGLPQRSETTKQKIGNTDTYIAVSSVTYDNDYRVQTTMVENDDNDITTTYEYDDFGHITKETISSPGLESRYTQTQYEAVKGRFPETVTNQLGHSGTKTFDPVFGNVLTETDANGLTVTHNYNSMGELIETISPNGKRSGVNIDWANNISDSDAFDTDAPQYAVYKSTAWAESTDADAVTYFDILGRKIRIVEIAFDGSKVFSDMQYNSKGQLTQTSLPYKTGETLQWNYATYDEYGRKLTETNDLGTIDVTYQYSANQVKVIDYNNNEAFRITKTDATGNIKRSDDEAGGEVYYHYNSSGTLKYTEVATDWGASVDTVRTVFEYDHLGNQTKLYDPSAGPISYLYNAYGELIEQTDAKGNKYAMTYDLLGRIKTKTLTNTGETTTYVYDTEWKGKIAAIKVDGVEGNTYNYDEYGMLTSETENIESGKSFTSSYTYDNYGRLITHTFPTGVSVEHVYNDYGYLEQVKKDNALIWKANQYNTMGQIESFQLGNGAVTTLGYDGNYRPKSINTVKSSTLIQNLEFNFKDNGQLTYRSNTAGENELFNYDELNRLTDWNGESDVFAYDGKGNITQKPDVASYVYGTGKYPLATGNDSKHAVTLVTGIGEVEQQDITYTAFNKVQHISQGAYDMTFVYGPGEQRVKTVLNYNAQWQKTKYFVGGNFEQEETPAGTRKLHYIMGGNGICAVYVQQTGQTDKMYYIHTDYLGSWETVTDENGAVVERYSFDAWGRRRNPTDWDVYTVASTFLFDRGFTGHEHLDMFSLINMNGRVYDPLLGRFLSPDPYVQMPDYTQNYNRYSYCLNNPLMYSDPSGEMFHFVLAAMGQAAVQGALSAVINYSRTNEEFTKEEMIVGIIKAGVKGAVSAGLMNRIGIESIIALGAKTGINRGFEALATQIASTYFSHAFANVLVGDDIHSYLNIGIGAFTLPLRDGKLSRNPIDYFNNIYSLMVHSEVIFDAIRGNSKIGFDKNTFRMKTIAIKDGYVKDFVSGSSIAYHDGGVLFLRQNYDNESLYHEGIHAVQAGISGGSLNWSLSWRLSYKHYPYADSPWETLAFRFSRLMDIK